MPAFPFLESRTIRYIGTRCYNQNLEVISCPISLPKLIIISVILGILVLLGLVFLIVTRCECCCRRRQPRAFVPIEEYRRPGNVYTRISSPHPPTSSLETLVEPQKIHAATHQYYRPYDV